MGTTQILRLEAEGGWFLNSTPKTIPNKVIQGGMVGIAKLNEVNCTFRQEDETTMSCGLVLMGP